MYYWIIHIFIIVPLIGYWSKRIQNEPLAAYFWWTLLAKLVAGLCMGWLYVYVYPNNDSWHYFEASKRLCEVARYDFKAYLHILAQNDPHTIARRAHHYLYVMKDLNWRAFFIYKILHIFHFLTQSNYWLTTIYLSMFAYWGLWRAANSFCKKFGHEKAFAFGFLGLPSVVFWASGVSKESIFWGFFGVFLSILWGSQKNKAKFLLLPVLIYALWLVKYYYLMVFLAVYLAYYFIIFLTKYWHLENYQQKLLFLLIFFVPLGLISQNYSILRPERILRTIVENNKSIILASPSENVIRFNLEANLQSFILESPKAFEGVFLRPFLWEKGNFLKKIVALENSILLILLIFSPVYFYRYLSLEVFACLIYVLFLGIILAFSAPNFGTLARYKVGFLPFWAFLCSYFFWEKKRKLTIFGFVIPIS